MHQPYSETTIIVCLKYTYNYINIHKEWWLICIICSGVWGQSDLHEFKANLRLFGEFQDSLSQNQAKTK